MTLKSHSEVGAGNYSRCGSRNDAGNGSWSASRQLYLGLWGLGVGRGWSRLEELVYKWHHNWQRHKYAVLSAKIIHAGYFNNVGLIPSLLLMPSKYDVKNSHYHLCRIHNPQVQQSCRTEASSRLRPAPGAVEHFLPREPRCHTNATSHLIPTCSEVQISSLGSTGFLALLSC